MGTNGAILVSNAFDSENPSVSHILYDSEGHVLDSQFFENRRRTGVSDLVAVRSAILDFDEINGISEIYEGRGYLESARNGKSVEVHGITGLSIHRFLNYPIKSFWQHWGLC